MNRLSITTLALSAVLHIPLVLETGIWIPGSTTKAEIKDKVAPVIYYVEEEKPKVKRQVKTKKVKTKKKAKEVSGGKVLTYNQAKEIPKKEKKVLKEKQKKEIKPGALKPVVENINLTDEATRKIFFNYYDTLRKRIQQNTIYPYHAKLKQLNGVAYISFVLERSGRVKQIVLLNSSGHVMLDEAAMNSIRKAEPFPSFPEKITPSEITLKVPISFETN